MNVKLVTWIVAGSVLAAGALGFYVTSPSPGGEPVIEDSVNEPVMALGAKVAPQEDLVEATPKPVETDSVSEDRPAPPLKKPRHSRHPKLSDAERNARVECLAKLATSELTEQQKKRRCLRDMKKAKRAAKRAVFACEADTDCVAARDACGWWKAVNAEQRVAFEKDGARQKSYALCKRRPRDEGPAPALRCNAEKKRCTISAHAAE